MVQNYVSAKDQIKEEYADWDQCTATDQTNADAVKFAPSSGTAFALTGNATDVIGYICVGY